MCLTNTWHLMRSTRAEESRLTRSKVFRKWKHLSVPKNNILTSGFFRNAPIIQDSQDVLYRLHQVYDVYVVSSAMEYPRSIVEKYEWLQEHFPFISWQKMVFCGSKNIVRADIMIDDHLKNLDYFIGVTYLFSAPHNHFESSSKHIRVHSWRQVAEILL